MQAKLLPIGAGIIIITPSLKPELFLAVEDLQHRRLRPIVVLIKPDTFGGSARSEAITVGLHHRHVPVCSIAYGDDLSVKLAMPVVYFQKPYFSATFSGSRD
jgi:hypothetical protein